MGFISEPEAKLLIELYVDQVTPDSRSQSSSFHQKFNTLIAILDADRKLTPGLADGHSVHTLEYLRSTSLTLLCSVLSCTSRLFRPDIWAPISALSRRLINQAIYTGDCSVGTIQAILINVYSKEPRDNSAYVKIGVAVAMAYQLGWNVLREVQSDQATNQVAARRKLVLVRICIFLFADN